jgi:hypothetical protein
MLVSYFSHGYQYIDEVLKDHYAQRLHMIDIEKKMRFSSDIAESWTEDEERANLIFYDMTRDL